MTDTIPLSPEQRTRLLLQAKLLQAVRLLEQCRLDAQPFEALRVSVCPGLDVLIDGCDVLTGAVEESTS